MGGLAPVRRRKENQPNVSTSGPSPHTFRALTFPDPSPACHVGGAPAGAARVHAHLRVVPREQPGGHRDPDLGRRVRRGGPALSRHTHSLERLFQLAKKHGMIAVWSGGFFSTQLEKKSSSGYPKTAK